MTSLKVTSLWNKRRSHSLENTLAWPAEEQKEWAVKTQRHTWRHTDGLLTSCTEIFHWDYGQCSGIGLSFTKHGIRSFLYVPSVPVKLGNLKKRHKEPIRLTKQNKTTPYRIVGPSRVFQLNNGVFKPSITGGAPVVAYNHTSQEGLYSSDIWAPYIISAPWMWWCIAPSHNERLKELLATRQFKFQIFQKSRSFQVRHNAGEGMWCSVESLSLRACQPVIAFWLQAQEVWIIGRLFFFFHKNMPIRYPYLPYCKHEPLWSPSQALPGRRCCDRVVAKLRKIVCFLSSKKLFYQNLKQNRTKGTGKREINFLTYCSQPPNRVKKSLLSICF